jgi:hypothetical protein
VFVLLTGALAIVFGFAAPPNCFAIAPIAPAPGAAALGSGAAIDFCNNCKILCLPFLSNLSTLAFTCAYTV